jgi:putative sigma-54 modulation protein
MQITISTRHGHLNNTTQEQIHQKIEKLDRFHDRITAAVVTVDLEHKETPEVEIRLSLEKSADMVASDRAEGLIAAFDKTIHKVEQQLRKHKEKKSDHRTVGRRAEIGPEVTE